MKKRIFQIIASVIVVITILSSFCLTSFAASLNINGTGSGNAGGSANTNSSGTGYSVQSTANFAGYRFTYMSSKGKWYGTKDIIRSSDWEDYTGRKTTTNKYSKKDLVDLYKSEADFSIELTTASSSTAIKDSGSYGLSYAIETASSDMGIWIKDAVYVNKVLKLMGYEVKKMKTTDQILVEPIILCQVGGTNYALTLTEIWMVAGSQFGYSASAKWGGATGTYDNIAYRLNGTFPNAFYVDEKNNICDVATEINLPENRDGIIYPTSASGKTSPSFAKLITERY